LIQKPKRLASSFVDTPLVSVSGTAGIAPLTVNICDQHLPGKQSFWDDSYWVSALTLFSVQRFFCTGQSAPGARLPLKFRRLPWCPPATFFPRECVNRCLRFLFQFSEIRIGLLQISN